MSSPRAFELAVQFHQQGRLVDAERLYREALRAKTSDFDALHMLGILKVQQGEPEEALGLFAAALEVDGASAAAHSNYGAALAALKRHEEALASYDRALALSPRNSDTLSNRADTLCDLGRTEEALADYDRALAINPRLLSALVNRGVLLRALGRPGEALASYDKALAVESRDAETWNNRGTALHDLDRESEALASYERALALHPDFLDALLNRGSALLVLKRPADALATYGRALALNPVSAEAHKGRGHALFDLARFEEALQSYDKAIAADPTSLDAMLHRARTLTKLDRHAQAIAGYMTLRKVRPDLPNLLSDLTYGKAVGCDWSDAGALVEELAARAMDGTAAVDPFAYLGCDASAEQQLQCARNWLRLKKVTGHERTWNAAQWPRDRIRIAYLSADFHRHATAHLMARLFEVHDRQRFEIIGVSFGPDDRSALRSRVIKAFDRFLDVTLQSNQEVARLLRDLRINIAVDLKGHTTDARIGILADRAAPVQASYLGYPGSTGAEFIDYVIADPIVLPLDQQPWYTERIVHLPDSYQVNDAERSATPPAPRRAEVGLPEQGFVFCCFNNSWKINARMFDIWMRILRKVEGSVLWLLHANSLAAANLRREAQARGIEPARLIFAPPLDMADHLARHQLADLFLDTLPYNAHTTASDSLWSGVPVVTAIGETFAGRVAASLLRAVGLPELITQSLGDYESLALRLAADRDLHRSMKEKLARNRQTYPLFDTRRFARHIEAAYTTMWEMFQRGERPRSFCVEPGA